uniref:DNAJ-containing protein X-domain domain-containing protein n=2 Tax=Proboscia inermis TaxID=420281 RepID=A0A7S0GHH7_9STRA|mmetsp:Transcript_32122/g.37170  ORF Transcript_32122/g.37170 Transcript_32122/m.37170 type:complete len:341 (+) Transcript_32122:211-1233(+)
MFGSALVEPYIGELWIASTAEIMMKDDGLSGMIDETMSEEEKRELVREQMRATNKQNEFKGKKRVVQCALHLRKRLESYDPKDPTTFIVSCQEEAFSIVKGAFGELYAVTIGFTMKNAAEEYLGFENSFLGLGGHWSRTVKNTNAFGNGLKLVGAGFKALSAGSRAMQEAERIQQGMQQEAKETGEEKGSEENGSGVDQAKLAEEMAKTMDDSLPVFLELVWAINKRDIQTTIKKVCKKIFHDASVDKEGRIKRAEAMRILGREFHCIGSMAAKCRGKSGFTSENIKARMSVAAMTTMAKAQGQEVTEEDQEEMIKQAKQESSMHAAATTEGNENAQKTG